MVNSNQANYPHWSHGSHGCLRVRPVLGICKLGGAGPLERSLVREGVFVVTPNGTELDCGKAPVPDCVERVGVVEDIKAAKGYARASEWTIPGVSGNEAGVDYQ